MAINFSLFDRIILKKLRRNKIHKSLGIGIHAKTLCGTDGCVNITLSDRVTCKSCLRSINRFNALIHEISSYTYLGD